MTEKHRREIEQLKEKYEKIIAELKQNASSDKEFLQMELKKRISELEREIESLKKTHAEE